MGYSRLQQVTEWLQWVRAGYSWLPSGFSVLQQVTAGYRVVTVGYSSIETCNSDPTFPFLHANNANEGWDQ